MKFTVSQPRVVTHCVCKTKQGWYDVGTDGKAEKDPLIEKILEDGLSFDEAYDRVMNLRACLLTHSE